MLESGEVALDTKSITQYSCIVSSYMAEHDAAKALDSLPGG